MSQKSKRPSLLGLVMMRCANCREGLVFINKSVFPLGKLRQMKTQCDVCGAPIPDANMVGGGIDYALTVLLFFLNLAWFIPIVGMSYKDNSIFYFLIVSIAIVGLVQPWLMRLSRMIYLYAFASKPQGF